MLFVHYPARVLTALLVPIQTVLYVIYIVVHLLCKTLAHCVWPSRKCVDDESKVQAFLNQFGNHEFVEVDDFRWHYVVSEPMINNTKPVLLLLHGFPDFWFAWRHFLSSQKLRERFVMIAVDTPGCGQSGKLARVSDYNARNLARMVHRLAARLGCSDCTVAGHDWGGVIAYSLVSMYPNYRMLLIFNAPDPAGFSTLLYGYTVQTMCSSYMFAFKHAPRLCRLWLTTIAADVAHMVAGSCSYGARARQAYQYMYHKVGFEHPLHYYRANVGSMTTSGHPVRVKCPLLIVWGRGDSALCWLVPLLSYCVADSDYQLKYIEQAKHFVITDSPNQCIDCVLDFCNKHEH